ncbi:hypothetical protein OEZ85_014088 [Tetradesmus obliquus]|uniref:Uncharacterized protein n=1 Tax=Tetradesmus obliquus TaxID=3088 RepID=A0ABY8UC06_TETOB|nr:hypothetical protein OEZ85_014088 [Tetradesmus obliquus]
MTAGSSPTGHLQVIVCVGETLDQHNSGSLWYTLDSQMQALFPNVQEWSRVVIAYETVCAIGTGQVATPQQAQLLQQHACHSCPGRFVSQ